MTFSTIAVHGATGTQGSPVARHLVAAGHRVRAIARHPRDLPAGVEPAAADVLDVDALTAAYTGVDAAVVQLPLCFDDTAVAQARSVLAALGKASVPRVVFNSGSGVPAGPIGVPFVDARALLWAELPGVVETVALVAPAAAYAENLAGPWSAPLFAAGELRYPLPVTLPVPWVAADDVAAAITAAITAPSPAPARLIAGPADLTGDEVAAELSAALNRRVRWRTITPAEYEKLLRPHLGATTAAGIGGSYATSRPTPNPSIIARGTTTIRQWARENLR